MQEFCKRRYKLFKLNAMSYIVIETFGGAEYANIVTDEEAIISCLIRLRKHRTKRMNVRVD